MQVNVTVHGNMPPEAMNDMMQDMGDMMGGMGHAMGHAMKASAEMANDLAEVHGEIMHDMIKQGKKELKKAAGFIDKSNKIRVELINPTGTGYYVGGDVVRGKIHLNCLVPFACNGVILKVKGYEKVKFQEVVQESTGEGENAHMETKFKELKESKEFFNQTLVPYPTAGIIPQGAFEYPFEFPLPLNLPGVFHEKGGDWKAGSGWEAKVEYKFIATVDVAFLNDLKDKVKLIINEKFDQTVRPSYAHDEKKFLIGDGKITVDINLDKNAYFPGERVLCKLQANNTSAKCTRKLVLKVFRYVHLKAAGKSKDIETQVQRIHFPGFAPNFYGVRWLPFYIPVNLPPSTKSNFIDSYYKFIVCCDIPGAIDLETPLDVRILAPQFLYSECPPQPAEVPPPEDVSFRPPWEDEDGVTNCHNCGCKFSIIKRKHHCRHCGKVFCEKCCSKKSTIPNLAYPEAVRVCDACYPLAQAGGNYYQKPPDQ
ncbi:FYVE-type zinc finger-containing protein [Histomonas meleagridis]|uniref:FYVE-type zinc finger-containing protein n=1 Tax=Histomonas meleagridis TaxID=135588 RepID=UPI003559A3C4|nr:FYVE-type zinc finger-containing protein [Histomonas meleagridis]KAH0804619.1 FYVE-type zinc finger-containing protein [Histomonas meleagridis]